MSARKRKEEEHCFPAVHTGRDTALQYDEMKSGLHLDMLSTAGQEGAGPHVS